MAGHAILRKCDWSAMLTMNWVVVSWIVCVGVLVYWCIGELPTREWIVHNCAHGGTKIRNQSQELEPYQCLSDGYGQEHLFIFIQLPVLPWTASWVTDLGVLTQKQGKKELSIHMKLLVQQRNRSEIWMYPLHHFCCLVSLMRPILGYTNGQLGCYHMMLVICMNNNIFV